LLPVTAGANFEHRLMRLQEGEFQCGRGPLTLRAIDQRFAD
jgi:hypothetical protein